MNLNDDTTKIDVTQLWVDSVSVTPQDRDWSTGRDYEGFNDGEHGWTSYQALYDETLDRYITPESELRDGEWLILRREGEVEAGRENYEALCESLSERYDNLRDAGYDEGPMMNYAYPLPLSSYDRPDAWAMADAIGDLPLCLVEDENGWYLALTGGGMDLSWEICEAFMRLGFLPPAHFADLPQMSGRPRGESDAKIVEACMRTFEVQKGWAERGMERLSSRFGVTA